MLIVVALLIFLKKNLLIYQQLKFLRKCIRHWNWKFLQCLRFVRKFLHKNFFAVLVL
ncbi:hypothetical protein GLOIN_2v1545485 [Rhizophagus irregularis DAOM 181602=DAOM 197198]|uniref:Uncharacterized protein n=1 Tax=Rhizophagus irregularis (strain DAOM 181602 / DAOM 197198 / MUCL 43194) TaxID=747089 RepID=A0A2P4QIU7_RHIID|nr:hypothetical protein GLOIN_2v1545485 [Rhizophagus irregularis DAOM 181602=DAOM 197198]POG77561.1 hypothetical protein GLOIN_2v1545485 [Rhizophagus irregularis DAOM 181602=DAOM 197198]|eukprot:XP_025184427.1 hypothetical protein GLOIN_2v1545485 [Rhizophagus irregularis DAOM 181602=DAOM 197198]